MAKEPLIDYGAVADQMLRYGAYEYDPLAQIGQQENVRIIRQYGVAFQHPPPLPTKPYAPPPAVADFTIDGVGWKFSASFAPQNSHNCGLLQMSGIQCYRVDRAPFSREDLTAVLDSKELLEHLANPKTRSPTFYVPTGYVLSTGLSYAGYTKFPVSVAGTCHVMLALGHCMNGAIFCSPIFDNAAHQGDSLQTLMLWITAPKVGLMVTDEPYLRINGETKSLAKQKWKDCKREYGGRPKDLKQGVDWIMEHIPYPSGNPIEEEKEVIVEPATW